MKKNSKVMNVLMSLFLVMGMVFGNSVVTAEDPEQETNPNNEVFEETLTSITPNIEVDTDTGKITITSNLFANGFPLTSGSYKISFRNSYTSQERDLPNNGTFVTASYKVVFDIDSWGYCDAIKDCEITLEYKPAEGENQTEVLSESFDFPQLNYISGAGSISYDTNKENFVITLKDSYTFPESQSLYVDLCFFPSGGGSNLNHNYQVPITKATNSISLPVSEIKTVTGSYSATVDFNGKRYDLGNITLENSGLIAKGTITSANSEGKNFEINMNVEEFSFLDQQEIILIGETGTYRLHISDDKQISKGKLSFTADRCGFNGERYLPAGYYTAILYTSGNVENNWKEYYYQLNQGEEGITPVYFARIGSGSDSTSCTLIFNSETSGQNFTITCAVNSQEEKTAFTSGQFSLELNNASNHYRLNNLFSERNLSENEEQFIINVYPEHLKKSQSEYIPKGNYQIQLNTRTRDSEFKYKLNQNETISNFGPVKSPCNIYLTTDANHKQLEIHGDETTLTNLYTYTYLNPDLINHSEEFGPQGPDFNDLTSIDLHQEGPDGKDFHIPMHEVQELIFQWATNKTTTEEGTVTEKYLVVPERILIECGISKGTYNWGIKCNYGTDNGYGLVEGYVRDGKGVTLNCEIPTVKEISITQDEDFGFTITVGENDKDFLQKIDFIEIRNYVSGGNGQPLFKKQNPDGSTSDNVEYRNHCINLDGKDTTIKIMNNTISWVYNSVESGECYAILKGPGYETVRIDNLTLKPPYKQIKEGGTPYYTITGDAIVMRSSDTDFADATFTPGLDFMRRISMIMLSKETSGALGVTNFYDKSFGGSAGLSSEWEKSTDSSNRRIVKMPLTYEELVKAGFTKFGKEDLYYIQQQVPGYQNVNLHGITYSLAPLKAAAQIKAVENMSDSAKTTTVLQEVDEIAKQVDKSKQNNCTVKEGEAVIDTEVEELDLNLYGAVGGAVKDDLTTVFDNAPEITVTKKFGDFETNKVDNKYKTPEDLANNSGLANVSATDVAFDIQIDKSYDNQPSLDGNVPELPYKAAVTFKIPDDVTVKEGQVLKLVSEHEGNILTYDVTVQVIDDVKQGVAYVDKYSSFVLVTADEIKPAPSKKESSSGSSAPKKDNVVTCQMAGYPANYAWNESVKACQPGYLDNNGVFHLTTGNTNKRVGVVNTSDKGVGGTIAALISSTIAAIAAAYALKKWN